MEEMTNLTPNEETPETIEETIVTEEVSAIKETPVVEEYTTISESPIEETVVSEDIASVYSAAPEVAESPKKKNLIPLFVGLGIALLVIVAGVIVSLSTKAPENEVVELYDSVTADNEDEEDLVNA